MGIDVHQDFYVVVEQWGRWLHRLVRQLAGIAGGCGSRTLHRRNAHFRCVTVISEMSWAENGMPSPTADFGDGAADNEHLLDETTISQADGGRLVAHARFRLTEQARCPLIWQL
jgi:hypothetical protein